jgi:hypothetical protein
MGSPHGSSWATRRRPPHAYRGAQEGLTNARKYAPGAAVTLTVRAPDGDVQVEVRSLAPVAVAAVSPLPGAGTGLIGLAERVTLPAASSSTASTPMARSSWCRAVAIIGVRRRCARALLPADDARRGGEPRGRGRGGRRQRGTRRARPPPARRRPDGHPHAAARRHRDDAPARRAIRHAHRARAHHVRRRRARPARSAGRRRFLLNDTPPAESRARPLAGRSLLGTPPTGWSCSHSRQAHDVIPKQVAHRRQSSASKRRSRGRIEQHLRESQADQLGDPWPLGPRRTQELIREDDSPMRSVSRQGGHEASNVDEPERRPVFDTSLPRPATPRQFKINRPAWHSPSIAAGTFGGLVAREQPWRP